MDVEQAKAVVLRFNDFINARDLEGLAMMMTDDHVFIDSAESSIAGKQSCVRAWQGFFAAFPDYRNDFSQLFECQGLLVVLGRSVCSDPDLDGPAIWSAKVRDNFVSEWRVFDDTANNRSKLGLSETR